MVNNVILLTGQSPNSQIALSLGFQLCKFLIRNQTDSMYEMTVPAVIRRHNDNPTIYQVPTAVNMDIAIIDMFLCDKGCISICCNLSFSQSDDRRILH